MIIGVLTKTKNLYSQINHTLQWYREVTYLTKRPNILKFKQIMCTSEKIKLEKLCRFIRKINQQIRSSLG
jgi:hypothetical protein